MSIRSPNEIDNFADNFIQARVRWTAAAGGVIIADLLTRKPQLSL